MKARKSSDFNARSFVACASNKQHRLSIQTVSTCGPNMTSQLVAHPSSNTTPPTPECHVEVRPSPTSGNGLFATKDIPAGSTILLKPRPLIGELDLPRLEESCHNCFLWSGCVIEGGEIAIKACTGCKKVKYCSKARFSC